MSCCALWLPLYKPFALDKTIAHLTEYSHIFLLRVFDAVPSMPKAFTVFELRV